MGILGNIPIVGDLFKSSSETSSQSETKTRLNIDDLTQRERDRLAFLDQQSQTGARQAGAGVQERLEQQSSLNQAFRDTLLQLATGSASPTPEQLSEATEFVDATFTAPAQLALDREIEDFAGRQQTQAAALGRQASDLGFQEELFGNIVRGQQDIQAQRAGLVQQRADELAFNRPLQQAQALGQGSRFFTDQVNTLGRNQANLLNIATNQQQLGQRERELRGETVQEFKGSGKATAAPSILGAASGVVDLIGSIGE